MHVLKRIALILIGLLLFAFVTVIFLVPDLLVALGENIAAVALVARIIIAVIIDAVLLALVYTQVRPAPKVPETGLMVKASGAITDISIESAKERILRVVRTVPDVMSASANLEAIHGKANIELDVVVTGIQVNVPKKQKEINQALRQVIEKQLGLQLASRPRVHIILHDEGQLTKSEAPALSQSPVEKDTQLATFPMPSVSFKSSIEDDEEAKTEEKFNAAKSGLFSGQREFDHGASYASSEENLIGDIETDTASNDSERNTSISDRATEQNNAPKDDITLS